MAGTRLHLPFRHGSSLGLEPLENRILLSTIHGSIWHDVNRDGLRTPTERFVPDVQVRLLDESGALIATVDTAALNGNYRFEQLDAGSYFLQFKSPRGTQFTLPEQDDDRRNSDVDTQGRSALVQLTSDRSQRIDAGIHTKGTIATVRGRAWEDSNANGTMDPEERGLRGTTVELVSLDRGFDVPFSTRTDKDGNYRIESNTVLPGNYLIQFRSNRDGRLLPLPTLIGATAGPDNHVVSYEATEPFWLHHVDSPDTPAEVVRNAAFSRPSSITGRIWHDVNRDGSQGDANDEYGVSGVTVELVDASNNVLATAESHAGHIEFWNLAPGDYSLKLGKPDGTAIVSPNQGDDKNGFSEEGVLSVSLDYHSELNSIAAGIYSTEVVPSIQGRVWHDLDADGLREDGEEGLRATLRLIDSGGPHVTQVRTDEAGDYLIDGNKLLPGEYRIQFGTEEGQHASPRNVQQGINTLDDSDVRPFDNMTPSIRLAGGDPSPVVRDAGYFSFGEFTGQIWDDVNRNGIHDATEIGLREMEVQLLDESDQLVKSVRSDERGRYVIDDVEPGYYSVRLQNPSGTFISDVPQGIGFDSKTGRTVEISITSGQTAFRDVGLFGQTAVTGISGVAWDDLDGNGMRDPAEPGFPNVEVHLLDGELRNVAQTATDQDGAYRFEGLAAGLYAIEFVRPDETAFSPLDVGADDFLDSDVNRGQGRTRLFPLITNQHDLSRSVGIYRGPRSDDAVGSLRVTEVAFIGGEAVEFVEVKNIGDDPLDLSGVQFTNGIRFSFDKGKFNTLFPGEYAVLVGSQSLKGAGFDEQEINVAGKYEGDLNQQETIRLADKDDETILEFNYDDDWFALTDDEDILPWTLSVLDEHADREAWNSDSNWRLSSQLKGSPGADDPRLTPDPGAVVINEIMAKSTDGYNDLIELHNTTNHDIDIGNWYLGDANARRAALHDLTQYRIAPGTIIGPNEYLVFSRSDNFGTYEDTGTIRPFGLSSFGEAVHLVAADRFGQLLGYVDTATFGGSEVGLSFGRHLNANGDGAFVMLREPTFGSANSEPLVGPIVIDEILYKPLPDRAEFIHLHNHGDQDVVLSDGPWLLQSQRFAMAFPAGTIMPPGSGLYVASTTPEVFRSQYSIPAHVPVLGPFGGELSNSDDNIQLLRHDPEFGRQILVDQVPYTDREPWPYQADIAGVSLVRTSAAAVGVDPANWTHSAHEPRQAVWNDLAAEGEAQELYDWNDPSFWTIDGQADVLPTLEPLGDDVVFASGGNNTAVRHDGELIVHSLHFEKDLQLDADELIVISGQISVAGSATVTLHSSIRSPNDLVLSGDGTVIATGSLEDVILESGTLFVEGNADDIQVIDGTLAVRGTADDIRVASGDIWIDGHVDDIDLSSGTIYLNGTAEDVQVNEGLVSGSGKVRDLELGADATFGWNHADEQLTFTRAATLAGTTQLAVGADLHPLKIPGRLQLSSTSKLELQIAGELASTGSHVARIISARSVSGTFSESPVKGDHLGAGVFLDSIQGGPGIVYHSDSVWAVLYQASSGDANGDGEFNQLDIVNVLQSDKYLTGQSAEWTDGDWNHDGRFDQLDIVDALAAGGYLAEAARATL